MAVAPFDRSWNSQGSGNQDFSKGVGYIPTCMYDPNTAAQYDQRMGAHVLSYPGTQAMPQGTASPEGTGMPMTAVSPLYARMNPSGVVYNEKGKITKGGPSVHLKDYAEPNFMLQYRRDEWERRGLSEEDEVRMYREKNRKALRETPNQRRTPAQPTETGGHVWQGYFGGLEKVEMCEAMGLPDVSGFRVFSQKVECLQKKRKEEIMEEAGVQRTGERRAWGAGTGGLTISREQMAEEEGEALRSGLCASGYKFVQQTPKLMRCLGGDHVMDSNGVTNRGVSVHFDHVPHWMHSGVWQQHPGLFSEEGYFKNGHADNMVWALKGHHKLPIFWIQYLNSRKDPMETWNTWKQRQSPSLQQEIDTATMWWWKFHQETPAGKLNDLLSPVLFGPLSYGPPTTG